MRTTVRLDEDLLRRAKKEAARRGETLTSLIDRGLRLVLSTDSSDLEVGRVELPVSTATGGLREGVELDDSSALLEIMDRE